VTERLVALERDGMLRLYSVNGGAPAEVGRLLIGRLDEAHAALVAAAFSDLRESVANAQLARPEPVHQPRALPSAQPVKPAPGKRAKRVRRSPHGGPSLNGQIRDYLRDHGASTVQEVYAALKPAAYGTKSGPQRTSTGLASLKAQGVITRMLDGRWRLRDGP